MQTAMQELKWFISDGLNNYDESIKVSKIWEKVNQLLELEKQQIIYTFELWRTGSAEQYFAKTYGSKGSDNSPKVQNKDTFGGVSSQTEISDEEIEKLSELEYPYDELVSTELKGIIVSAERAAWIEGIKWYREQLKSK